MALRILGIFTAILVMIPAVFVSQLYSPTIMWVISFLIILISPTISFLKEKKWQVAACAILSLIINFNYILYIPFGNPILEIAVYGIALYLLIFSMIFVIVKFTGEIRGRAPVK
jgi:hypothetical protein